MTGYRGTLQQHEFRRRISFMFRSSGLLVRASTGARATALHRRHSMNMRPLYHPQFAQTEAVPDQMCERFWTLPKLKKLRAEAMLDNAMLNDIAAR